jgi:ADP-heptose:LPS heptosyltransferase
MTGRYRARSIPLVTAMRGLDLVGRIIPNWSRPPPKDRPLKVLVANWGHLGDVVALLPLLKFLEQSDTVGELGVLIGSWSQQVLQTTDLKARLHVIDHWALDRKPVGRSAKIKRYAAHAGALVKELSDLAYDVSIDTFSTFPATHGLTWRARIPMRVGFDSAGCGTWLTHPVPWIPIDALMIEQQLRLLAPVFGADAPPSLPATYPGFRPSALPADLGVSDGGHIILHMGSGASSRDWDVDKWIWLANQLRQSGLDVVATGGPGREAELARTVASRTGVTSLAGRLSWAQLVTVVARAKAIVSVDTVIGHLAAAFDIPTVVLTAGRQRLANWRPNSDRAWPMTHPVACAPCFRTDGCQAMACIRLIDQADVLTTLQRLLGNAAFATP